MDEDGLSSDVDSFDRSVLGNDGLSVFQSRADFVVQTKWRYSTHLPAKGQCHDSSIMPYMQCGLENFNKAITLNSKLNHSNQTSYVTVSASWKVRPKFFKLVNCNPCQSSPSLAVLVPFCFIIISLVSLYIKRLFSVSLQWKCNFVLGQNNA